MNNVFDGDGRYKRVFEIDLIRGLCMLLVLFDHLMYNLAINKIGVAFFIDVKDVAIWYWNLPLRGYVRAVVVGIFFLVSGISSGFSKNNARRGLKILGVAILLSLGSSVAVSVTGNPWYGVDFGVIHVFACCILIFYLLRNWGNLPLLAVAVSCVLAGWYIPSLDIKTTSTLFLPLGITPIGYAYADYVPLFPWLGFFILGGVMSRKLYPQRVSLYGDVSPRFSKWILHIGRWSLFYYFGEQALLIPLFYFAGVIW